MKRIINADELKSDILSKMYLAQKEYLHKSHIVHQIDIAPTVDAVEVVRCKDCKHYHPYKQSAHYNNVKNQCCRSATVSTKPDDFCSYGERKDND